MTEAYYCPLSGSGAATDHHRRPVSGTKITPLTWVDKLGLRLGDKVSVRLDDGVVWIHDVQCAPWLTDCNDWLIGLRGIVGGYSLERVVGIMED